MPHDLLDLALDTDCVEALPELLLVHALDFLRVYDRVNACDGCDDERDLAHGAEHVTS